ncbi:MAG: NAD(P)-dependent oxidoreductase [Desulfosarcinaceae bacterium]
MDLLDIGWIGTGVMGRSMCGHLIHRGHKLHIHNRTREKAEDLVQAGAEWCDTPDAVARKSDIIFTMVGYPQDVEQVVSGPQGLLQGTHPGAVIVDMTTSSPDLAKLLSQRAAGKGVHLLDAPVSGGDVGAREATLAIMVGGEKEVFEKIRPLFEILGKTIAFMGPTGSGQHTKMCNQILIAGTMIGCVESLLYARKAGLSPDAVIDIIGKGAASSWTINNLGRRIAGQDYNPGFYIKHFVKDMGIALDEAQRMQLCLPGLAMVQQFYLAALSQGHGQLGTQGLYRILAQLNNMTP